ncbi:MAG: hypothetical protein DMG97_32845 [Acidobacteria bacterium]|nr:MAG: hypothetical protein DMG97_32845 [Acidobacteriota bacterium]
MQLCQQILSWRLRTPLTISEAFPCLLDLVTGILSGWLLGRISRPESISKHAGLKQFHRIWMQENRFQLITIKRFGHQATKPSSCLLGKLEG